MVWLALIAFFALFDLFQQADDHSMALAAAIVFLRLPWLALLTLPFACALGAVFAARRLTQSGEMSALRAAGMSPRLFCLLCLPVALFFLLAYFLLSEFFAPAGAEWSARLQGGAPATRALWLKTEDNYIRINRMSADGKMEDVAVYYLQGASLRAVATAPAARFANGRWRLGAAQTVAFAGAPPPPLELRLPPKTFEAFFAKPRNLPIFRAAFAAFALRAAGQGLAQLWESVWTRLLMALALPFFVLFGVWFVSANRGRRATTVAVFAAVLLPGVYYASAKIVASAAWLTDWHILLALPPLALAAAWWRAAFAAPRL